MSRADDPSLVGYADSHDQRRHDLLTPLTTILGQAQLLARSVRRSPSLSEAERAQMQRSLIHIEHAVRRIVAVIDGGGQSAPGRDHPTAIPDGTTQDRAEDPEQRPLETSR